MTDAPERTVKQRRDALDRANEIRLYRATLKRNMRAGSVHPATILRDVPPDLETMKLQEFLLAIPAVGPIKAKKILTAARISPSKTLGGLSARQRGELLFMLGARIPHRLRRLSDMPASGRLAA